MGRRPARSPAFSMKPIAGIGYRAHYSDVFERRPPESVHWIEVISENYLPPVFDAAAVSLLELERIRSHIPMALHGVSLNAGGTTPLDRDYLKRLNVLVARLEPFVVSDHLCFTQVPGLQLHDLLPLPYRKDVLSYVAHRIEQTQHALGRRLTIENVSSYLEYRDSEMPEWEFLAELARRTGCGLLLDVNNIFVSAVNHGFDPSVFIQSLPPTSITEMHLAGHTERGGILIDTHDHPVRPEVWALYQQACQRFPGVPAMIERDGRFPPWKELEQEVLKISALQPKQESPHHGDRTELLV